MSIPRVAHRRSAFLAACRLDRGRNMIIWPVITNYRLEHSKRDLTDMDTLGKSSAQGQLTSLRASDLPRVSMSDRSRVLCSN